MKRKYKTLTANQKSGKCRSIEEVAKELLAFQNQKQNTNKNEEQYDDDDSAGMEYIQDMLDNF